MNSKRISIVIISFNTKDLLDLCIKSVLKNLNQSTDEVLVVDNASKDGTPKMIRENYPWLTMVESEKNRGFAYACNLGLENSKGKYVLLVNGDIEFPDGSIEAMYQKMESDQNIGILSPQLLGRDGGLEQMTWGWNLTFSGELKQKFFSPKNIGGRPLVRDLVSKLQKKERSVPIVAGACMFTRKDVMDFIKGLDQNFELYFEDADLCVRCWKAGFSVRFVPQIHVLHGLGQSGKKLPQVISMVYRQSQIYFYRKHNPVIELVLLKIYLWIKFLFSKNFWTSSFFRYWIVNILFERRRFYLSP
ncbi:MAG: glycosyltransferase [Elusimicrobia bacterium]|nr:glycosyltransferase [Candidatus Obscuribacterium magneticum]